MSSATLTPDVAAAPTGNLEITVSRAELLRDGNVIDTFNGIHSTERGGAFGQVLHTTCEALSNISDTMVNDTYQWYVNRGASTSTRQPAAPFPDVVFS